MAHKLLRCQDHTGAGSSPPHPWAGPNIRYVQQRWGNFLVSGPSRRSSTQPLYRSIKHILLLFSAITFLLLCFTSFPCRYRQKAGFAGPWEPATFTRRRESTSSVTPTHRLMNGRFSIFEQGGARIQRDGDDAYMRGNPKTLNRSGVYIYNNNEQSL